MAASRERARNLLIKALYQWQVAGNDYPDLLDQFRELAEFRRIDQNYFTEVLQHCLEDTAALDELIGRYSSRPVQQIDAIGRAVLLLAMAELKHRADVPRNVVIDEAIKLARRYGAVDSYRFVNAIADKAAADLRQDGRANEA